jgi:hypothetical protein
VYSRAGRMKILRKWNYVWTPLRGPACSPCPIPPGETQAEFPPEPTHSCVRAASGGQGRPGSAARVAGCLDRRLIRRATLTCLRLRGCVSIPTGLPVHHWCSPVARSIAPEFFAPDLSEGVTPRRVSRRVFNSPQPARTIGRVFDTPPRAPSGCASPGFAGRPRAASRAPRTPCGARRPRSPPGQTAGAMHPRMNSAGAASFARRTSLLQEVV